MRRRLPHAVKQLLALCLVAWAGVSQAATVSSVQSGTVVSGGNGTLSVSLTQPVNPAATVLFFSTRHASTAPGDATVRGRLADADTVEFVRVTSSNEDLTISWYLVEFAAGVRVQRGQAAQTGNTLDVSLAQPVSSTGQALLLYSKTPAAGDSEWGSNDPIGGYLRNASSLRFRTDSESSHLIDYQVVEFTNPADVLVQSGDVNVSSNATQIDVTLPQNVDPANTFVLAGHTINGGGDDIERRLFHAQAVDADTIRFTRQSNGNDIGRIVWQAIELRDGSRVMQGTEHFPLLSNSQTVALPGTVDPSRAVAFSGMQSFGGQSMGSAEYSLLGNYPGISSFTFDLSGSELEMARDSRYGPAHVGWFVLEFNDVPVAPPAAVLDVAMNEPSWNGTPGEVTDAAAGNHGDARNGAGTARAGPAIPGNPGTCGYGDFDGADDYLAFADAPHLDMTDALTVSIWINTRNIPGGGNLRSIVSKDTNYEFHVDSQGRIYWWWNDSSGTVRSFTSAAAVTANRWHHVAITYRPGDQVIYLDGVPVGSASHVGNLANNALELQVGQDQGIAGRFWNGYLDELRIYDQALEAAQVQTLMNETRPCLTPPAGDWRFDEYGWNGSAGEVLDHSGNGRHGTAVNTVTDIGLVCNAADLSADGISDWLTLDPGAFDGLTDMTLAVWYRGTQNSAMSIISGSNAGEMNELIYFFWAPDRFDPHTKGDEGADIAPPVPINDGNWHFLVWTRSGTDNCLYVDDVLAGCGTRDAGALDIDPNALVVGQEQDSIGGGFDAGQDVEGDLDELLLFDRALSAAELSAIRTNHLAGLNWDGSPRDCPVSGATGFIVSHDGAGIHCLAEPVTVTAVDPTNAVVPGYSGEVTLDTGTGRGSWSVIAGGGSLVDITADDGVATYRFAAGDSGSATFALSYPEGPASVDVAAHQTDDPTVRDDDSEATLIFAPRGLVVTAGSVAQPPPLTLWDPIPTQTAAADFAVHITAYGHTDDDPADGVPVADAQCGVIESYTADRDLSFATTYVNPAAGTRLVSVDGQPADGSPRTVTFDAGRALVTVRYKDAGAIGLGVTDAGSFPNTLTGATNAFVVQPAELVISRVQSAAGVGNPGAATAVGPAFVPAGEAFRVDVEARDAEGDITPNYGLESPAEGVVVTLNGYVVPAAGAVGTLSNGTGFVASGVAGRFSNAGVVFDEVGAIRLRPEVADGDYLGTGAVAGVSAGPVGRFHPAGFDLVSSAVTAACGPFTYMDQPGLGVSYRLRALNVSGNVARNYDAALLADPDAVDDVGLVGEAADDGVNLSARLSAVPGAWVAGEMLVNRPDVTFFRLAAPDGPYDPLQLGITITDSLDGVPLLSLDLNPAAGGDCMAAGNCTARRLGAPTRMVYGRVAVLPTSGPENENLPLPLAAQMFTGSAFEHNPADACSTYSAGGLLLGGYAGNLAAGETSPIAPAGVASLVGGAADAANPPVLSAPGFGNDGSVNVTLDVDAWLEFDWLGAGAADPAAAATFGRYRGHDRIIYWGEPR